ncbi:unnamed protein product, partial [Rotaria magnacalcarata]
QTTVICPTAIWNSTFRTLAGISGVAASTATTLYNPYRAVFGPSNTLYVADQSNNRIQKYVGGSATGTAVTGLTLSNPCDVYVDNNNVLYVMDTSNYRVLRWNNNVVTVVAGGFGAGSTYDKMSTSYSMFVDASYNIYVSDYGNHRVAFWSAGNPNMSQLVAGGYGAGSTPEKLYYPLGIYVDNMGIIYVADYYNHRIQQWYPGAATGITVAGQTGVAGSWSYLLYYPTAVIYDQYNYLYIVDSSNNRVQRWVPGASYGITVASSTMSNPRGLSLDSSGNIIVADMSLHRIISFAVSCPPNATTTTSPTTQAIVPVCSTGGWNQTFTIIAGSSGNRGTSATLLYNPYSSFIDIYGNLYVVDYYNHRIQYFLRGSTTATTVAGITSSAGSSYSQLYYPTNIYVDSNGIMYILDATNCRVLRWTPGDPMGFSVAGDHGCGSTVDKIDVSYAMFIDSQYNIYISEYANHRVSLWTPRNTTAGTTVAGGYGAGSTAEKLYYPWGIYADANQVVFVVDRSNHRVQRWNSGAISGLTVAGSTSDPGPWSYQFSNPTAITFDPYGYMYILDTGNSRVQKWLPGATFGTTVIAVSMSTPYGLIFDRRGNIVITDQLNYRILSFAITCPNATTTTASPPTTPQTSLCTTAQWNSTFSILAGVTSTAGSSSTLLYYPYNIYFDGYNNLYVADTSNHRIQYYPQGTSIGITVAGSTGSPGSTYSQLYNPYAIYVDSNRAMFILDTTNYRVLKWQFGDPRGFLVAGGNGAGAASNQITTSYAMFVDAQSNVYVSEYSNHRVTLWLSTNTSYGTIIAGGYGAGSASQQLYYPWGICVDSNQVVYVVDRNNHRVQRWPNGAISGSTAAGTTGDAGPYAYQLSSPTALLLDQYGYLYVLDYGNSRIQKWFPGA